MEAVAVTKGMDSTTDDHLGVRVLPPDPGHAVAALFFIQNIAHELGLNLSQISGVFNRAH